MGQTKPKGSTSCGATALVFAPLPSVMRNAVTSAPSGSPRTILGPTSTTTSVAYAIASTAVELVAPFSLAPPPAPMRRAEAFFANGFRMAAVCLAPPPASMARAIASTYVALITAFVFTLPNAVLSAVTIRLALVRTPSLLAVLTPVGFTLGPNLDRLGAGALSADPLASVGLALARLPRHDLVALFRFATLAASVADAKLLLPRRRSLGTIRFLTALPASVFYAQASACIGLAAVFRLAPAPSAVALT